LSYQESLCFVELVS